SRLAGYHESALVSQRSEIIPIGNLEFRFNYAFSNFFHPFVGELISKLNKDSLTGVMDAAWQDTLAQDFFNTLYTPTETTNTQVNYCPKQIDVEEHGPYANYNWELFYHIPLTVAAHLSKTRRFAEAQRWFHFIFNPTSNDKSIDPPKRFWNFLAFRKD